MTFELELSMGQGMPREERARREAGGRTEKVHLVKGDGWTFREESKFSS